jgi:hypothetical protein
MKADEGRAGFEQHVEHVRIVGQAAIDRAQGPGRFGAELRETGRRASIHAASRTGSGRGVAWTKQLTLKGRSVRALRSVIIERAPAASVAPTAIEPSAPAFDTAAARAGVEVPAIGACTRGSERPRRARKSMRSFCPSRATG